MTTILLPLDSNRLGKITDENVIPPQVDFEGKPYEISNCSRVYTTHNDERYYVVVPALKMREDLKLEIDAPVEEPVVPQVVEEPDEEDSPDEE